MFGRIQNIDNRVLDNISRIHKPALNKIMITASRAGNAGIVWWAICLPFLINSNWRATGANFVFGLAWAHLMGEIIIKHITFMPILMLAMLIAFSRIYLRVHYLTDVIAGMILGLTCGICSVLIFNTVVPMWFPMV